LIKIQEFRESVTNKIPAIDDHWPGLILMIQAVLGTCWWLISMFVYVKNASPDSLTLVDGTDTFPMWWWF